MNKRLFKRVLFGFIILFIFIFILRAVYEIITPEVFNDITGGYSSNAAMQKDLKVINNYASLRMEYVQDGSGPLVMDQKYESIANIVSKTSSYDSDMERFDAIMEQYQAVIQIENRRGLTGNRRIDLVIGVRPENFDDMQSAVLKLGIITSSNMTKTDKTYEYRQMLAEKETLERRKESYEALKQHGGNISELMKLEEKIIEIEADIRQQLIGLGEFSDENALCTINFSLYEEAKVSIPGKLWSALKWTATTYAAILAIVLFLTLTAFVFTALLNYLKKTFVKEPANNFISETGNEINPDSSQGS